MASNAALVVRGVQVKAPKFAAYIASKTAAAADKVLADGDLLGIFPEGALTRDGELAEFKGGTEEELAEVRIEPVSPALMRRMADAIPMSRYAELRGIGHLMNLEAPDEFDATKRLFEAFFAARKTALLDLVQRATGLAMAIPPGFEIQVRPRSGLALKHGITVPNTPGTIDSDYRGELKVILINHGADPFEIRRGDRVAQLVLAPVTRAAWLLADELDETERGEGGFGSTGGVVALGS